MKKAYVIMGLLTAAALTLVAQEDHTSRAGVGEKAFIIINHIKYDKKQQFDDVLTNEVMVASREYVDEDEKQHAYNQQSLKTMRILRPTQMNQDSTWTFIFMADPYIDNAYYFIDKPLVQKYGEEKAKEVFGRWSECFDRGQEVYLNTQTDI